MKKLPAAILAAIALLGTHAKAVDYFTEYFSNNDFDLNGLSLTFTPDNSTNFYAVAATNITALPEDTSGAATLPLGDDNVYIYGIREDEAVYFFGVSYVRMRIASNGFISFNESSGDRSPSLAEHFALRRIALFWMNLNPNDGGDIYLQQTSTKIVVTYENVAFDYDHSKFCNAQVELFFDGSIRMSWLNCSDWYNILVGLSDGSGEGVSIPVDYVETDLSEIAFDRDRDGLPDAWEVQYFYDPLHCNPHDNFWDEDGYDNLCEYIAGTDPFDSDSYFRAGCAAAGSQMSINWNALEGRKYRVWYRSTLDNDGFTALSGYLNYPQTNYVVNPSLDQGYFKVTVEME